jgi:RNA polymerase sigma factor (sigma-70 family)
MAGGQLSYVRQYIRKLVGLESGDVLADGQLLERYLARQDGAAFTALVHRYGPLVLGVCERVLSDPNDAEDAFQATFLVLVRKAAQLDRRGPLGNWLYAVAYRTALKVRAGAARRRAREREALEMPDKTATPEAAWNDLRPVLDEELNQLPYKYRAPLVLCYLEGKTNEQAARELGWPTGSMSRRVARGKELLRKRLLRRGIVMSAALLFPLLAHKASAAVPVVLERTTVQAAMAFKVGTLAKAGVASSRAARAADQVLSAMKLAQLKVAASVGLALLGVVGVGVAATQHERHATSRRPVVVRPARAICPYWRGAGGDGSVEAAWLLQGTLEGHTAPVLTVAFHPDGAYLASGSQEPAVVVWDLASGRESSILRGHMGPVRSVVFSPDGRTLASASDDGTIRLWKVVGGKDPVVLRGHDGPVLAVAFGPGGTRLASGGADGSVRIWDITTGGRPLVLSGHTGAVNAVAYSPDGNRVFSAGQDQTIRFWDARTGRALAGLNAPEAVQTMAVSPDGKLLAGGGPQTLTLWDLMTRTPRAKLKGHTGPVRAVTFTLDGRTLVSASQDRTLRVWDVEAPQGSVVVRRHGDAVNAVACAPDGLRLATGSADQSVRVWQMDRTPPTGTAMVVKETRH